MEIRKGIKQITLNRNISDDGDGRSSFTFLIEMGEYVSNQASINIEGVKGFFNSAGDLVKILFEEVRVDESYFVADFQFLQCELIVKNHRAELNVYKKIFLLSEDERKELSVLWEDPENLVTGRERECELVEVRKDHFEVHAITLDKPVRSVYFDEEFCHMRLSQNGMVLGSWFEGVNPLEDYRRIELGSISVTLMVKDGVAKTFMGLARRKNFKLQHEQYQDKFDDIVDYFMNFRPSKIILFGSQARREAAEDSDFDFLLVFKGNKPSHKELQDKDKHQVRGELPCDVLLADSKEFNHYKDSKFHVFGKAAEEGVILYNRDGREVKSGFR